MKGKTYNLIFIKGCHILIVGIIVTIILLIRISIKKEENEKNEENEPEKEDWEQYDYYVFSIFLPASSCFNKYSGNKQCFERVRELNIDNYFIIHGLWPSYISGKYMDDCNKNEEINITFDDEEYTNKLTSY